MTTTDLLIVVLIWLVCAVGAYVIADRRGDPSPTMWGVVGLILGPIGLLTTALMSSPAKTPK